MKAKKRSRVGAKPVSAGLVGLEGLFSELLVATVLDSVEFKSVRVGVHIMVLGKQVGDWVDSSDDAQQHSNNNLSIRYL